MHSGSSRVDVSIIVVAWNVKDLLRNCLESVFRETTGIRFEVIYVDNGSIDGSVEMVTEAFPQVRMIRNQTNEGFIRANNQGIHISTGRYVLLLNSDTIVLNNAVAKLTEFADTHPEAAVVGPRVLNPDWSLQRACFMFPSALNMLLSTTFLHRTFPASRFFGRERMTWWSFNEEREVETVCGCCSLVRKSAVDRVGMMDERYFVYGDDPDWCFRFNKAGWKNMFTPAAQIIHYGGQNTNQEARRFRLQSTGSTLIFMRLHRHWVWFTVARLLNAAFFLSRAPYWLAVALVQGENRKTSLDTAAAYVLGCFYCLTDWTRLLMNRDAFRESFRFVGTG